ncbi:MAG: RIP metalloprotease RseP [Opitutaceae bacterium]|nr:RIP metalloprotease RseP [Opitutaceae bacterium]
MITSFLESIFSNLWAIFLIIVFFGGSIFFHELGHFLAARRRGLKIDRFSIGFGPKILTWNKDGIEYCISLFPLGGYVALPQLADMRGIEGDPDHPAQDLPQISYTSRIIVSIMGVVFNVIFAFLLSLILWKVGLPAQDIKETTQIGYVVKEITLSTGEIVTGPAYYAGLQAGDIIRSIDGKKVKSPMSATEAIILSSGRDEYNQPKIQLSIERGAETKNITVYPKLAGEDKLRRIGIGWSGSLIVGRILKNSPAQKAGLQQNDELISFNGIPFYSNVGLSEITEDTQGAPLVSSFKRGEQLLETVIVPEKVKITEEGTSRYRIGIEFSYPVKTIYPNPITQIKDIFSTITRTFSALIKPKSDVGIQHMSGPAGIAKGLFDSVKIDIRIAIWFTVYINLSLAFFNLLPIPVLDGGHILFATISKIRGRALPPQFVAASQGVFMILLFSLIIFVSYKDISRFTRSDKPAETSIEPVFTGDVSTSQ